MEKTFHLQIVSLDGLIYDGEAISVIVRCTDGDKAILANHSNYCAAVGMGVSKVRMPDDTVRQAACIGGMLSVINGKCTLIVTTWEWSDELDLVRAKDARKRAEEILKKEKLSENEINIAEAKLKRALVRINAIG